MPKRIRDVQPYIISALMVGSGLLAVVLMLFWIFTQ
jgi:hypothetical protein